MDHVNIRILGFEDFEQILVGGYILGPPGPKVEDRLCGGGLVLLFGTSSKGQKPGPGQTQK
jgi:hypothetical protein